MDEESGEEQERSRFVTFWTSLPGVLTGIAAVIAAVVSLVALFGPGRGEEELAEPPTVAAAEPPVGGSTAPPPSGSDIRVSPSTTCCGDGVPVTSA